MTRMGGTRKGACALAPRGASSVDPTTLCVGGDLGMRRSGRSGRIKERPDPEQLPQRAEQLARAIEEFIRRRAPLHTTPACDNGQVEPLDWSAAGCEALCALCLLNRSLSIYRMRA